LLPSGSLQKSGSFAWPASRPALLPGVHPVGGGAQEEPGVMQGLAERVLTPGAASGELDPVAVKSGHVKVPKASPPSPEPTGSAAS
jgi:hypothetical protein